MIICVQIAPVFIMMEHEVLNKMRDIIGWKVVQTKKYQEKQRFCYISKDPKN